MWFLVPHPQEYHSFDGRAAVRAERGELGINEGGLLMGLLLAWEIPLTGGGRPGEDALSSTSHLSLWGLDAGGPQVARRFLVEHAESLQSPLPCLQPCSQASSLLLLQLGPLLMNSWGWLHEKLAVLKFAARGHLTPKGSGEDAPGAGAAWGLQQASRENCLEQARSIGLS